MSACGGWGGGGEVPEKVREKQGHVERKREEGGGVRGEHVDGGLMVEGVGGRG